MVKVTVIEEILSKHGMSMVKLISQIEEMLRAENEHDSAYKVNEGILRHSMVRSTLPKDTKIRKAILAIVFEKEFSDVTGKELCSIVLKHDLKIEIENQFKEIQPPNFEELKSFKENKLGNLIKNYQFGNYSELEFLKATIVLMLIRKSKLSYDKDKEEVLNSVISYINDEEDIIEKSVPLDVPLKRVAEVARINAYRIIIDKLLEIR